MTEEMMDSVPEARPPRKGWLRGVIENPVMVKELRSRMRGSRAFLILTIYLLILAGTVSLAFIPFLRDNSPAYDLETRKMFGKTVFGIGVLVQLLTISFIAPGLSAGSIASERERLTYDILRTTLLSARSVVLGKLTSALAFVLLLLLAAFPIQSLGFLFGGVGIEEIMISTLMLITTAIVFSAVGIFFSSFLKRTLVSTVLSYALTIFLVIGLPLLLILLTAMASSFYYASPLDRITDLGFVLFVGIVWSVIAVNPLSAGIATEIILLEEQSPWSIKISMPSGGDLPVPSPWIGYVVGFLLLSLLLTWLSIAFVRRPER